MLWMIREMNEEQLFLVLRLLRGFARYGIWHSWFLYVKVQITTQYRLLRASHSTKSDRIQEYVPRQTVTERSQSPTHHRSFHHRLLHIIAHHWQLLYLLINRSTPIVTTIVDPIYCGQLLYNYVLDHSIIILFIFYYFSSFAAFRNKGVRSFCLWTWSVIV